MYASLVVHSYFLSLTFSFVQMLCLSYYVVSYLPGGAAGLNTVLSLASTVAKTFLSSLFAKK